MSQTLYSREKSCLDEKDLKFATTLICINELDEKDFEKLQHLLPCHNYELVFYNCENKQYASVYLDVKQYYHLCGGDCRRISIFDAKKAELECMKEFYFNHYKSVADRKKLGKFIEKQFSQMQKYFSEENTKTKGEN